MKKLLSLALIAFFALNTESAFSQSIVLINGKASKVTLTGDQINTIVQHQINDYLESFDQAPIDEFHKAEPRLDIQNAVYATPTLGDQASMEILTEEINMLSADRPDPNVKEE